MPFIESDHPLLASSHLDLGLDNRVTPAFDRLMLFASFEPLAILDFSAHIGYMRAYKALGFGFVSLPAYEAPYGQEAIDTLAQQDRGGLWTDATARLKAAFEESDLPFRVDLLDWHAIPEHFRATITRRYEVIQEATSQE